jgi:hypothetical protein
MFGAGYCGDAGFDSDFCKKNEIQAWDWSCNSVHGDWEDGGEFDLFWERIFLICEKRVIGFVLSLGIE